MSISSLSRPWTAAVALGLAAALSVAAISVRSPEASAAQTTVQMGTAGSFAVLAGQTITNTGATTISGNLGLHPGTSVADAGTLTVTNGTEYIADAVALQAQTDLTTAYNDAAGRTPTQPVAGGTLGGVLVAGVYNSASSLALSGTVTLNGQNNPDSVFIFQAGSTLTVPTGSSVVLTGGAQACNVFWQVGSSATLDTTTNFVGTILASTSVALKTGATVNGRVLASTGSVTLEGNTITAPTTCLTSTTVAPTTTTVAPTTTTVAPTTTTVAPTTTTVASPPRRPILKTSSSSHVVALGRTVHDIATVTGPTGAAVPTGSVRFSVCGPHRSSCQASTGRAIGTRLLSKAGVATSPAFTARTAGSYCFAAVYTPTSGSVYATATETGRTTNGECFTVTASPVAIRVTHPPTPAHTPPATPPRTPPVVVPPVHTGEPWAGWLYWLLAGTAGLAGIALLTDQARRRRAGHRQGG